MRALLLAVSILVTIAPSASSAAPLKAGFYDLSGVQTICLKPDRTWYGVSYALWGGIWQSGRTGTSLYGTFTNFGFDGNDSVVLGPDDRGIWQEWTDDFEIQYLNRNAYLAYLGDECPPPAREGAGSVRVPSARD